MLYRIRKQAANLNDTERIRNLKGPSRCPERDGKGKVLIVDDIY